MIAIQKPYNEILYRVTLTGKNSRISRSKIRNKQNVIIYLINSMNFFIVQTIPSFILNVIMLVVKLIGKLSIKDNLMLIVLLF